MMRMHFFKMAIWAPGRRLQPGRRCGAMHHDGAPCTLIKIIICMMFVLVKFMVQDFNLLRK